MVRLIVFIVTMGMTVVVADAQTSQLSAYEALRTVGKAKGEALLGQLLEMRGRDGSPQPSQWVLTFKDTAARGGIREFTVASKGITAERAPVQGGDMALIGVIGAGALNLDSAGVFDATDKEAVKARLGFETLDYRLQNRNGVPVWSVQLYDVGGNEVGLIEFSAKNGTIVTPLRVASSGASSSSASKVATTTSMKASPTPEVKSTPVEKNSEVATTASGNSEESSIGERWAEGGGLFGHVGRWSQRAWETTTNSTSKAGESVKVFFVGRPEGSGQ